MFTPIFLCFAIAHTLLLFFLTWRHLRHIEAHRRAVPAAFADRISLVSHQKAADYSIAQGRFSIFSTTLDLLLLLLFTVGGGLAALHSAWSVFPGMRGEVGLIFSVLLIMQIAGLPLAWYQQFVIEARFGFNKMTPTLFFSDLIKEWGLALIIGTPLILVILFLVNAMGEMGWLYIWLVWVIFSLTILFVFPRWIAPLFNKFSPLPEGEARFRIESLLKRCGFRSDGLFVMDGSKRSSHGNAYFTGFGKSKRIVFFDTLLEKLSPSQVEAVLAHELGHFRCHHLYQRLAMTFTLAFVFFWILGQLLHAPWFFSGLGVPMGAENAAVALLLFVLVLPVFTFPFTPIFNRLSRKNEFEADAYAAKEADAKELVQALVLLYQDNGKTLTPDPWHSCFHDSHPPAALRIAKLESLSAA